MRSQVTPVDGLKLMPMGVRQLIQAEAEEEIDQHKGGFQ